MATDETEYGGKSGIIQKAEDGHVDLTPRERRLVNAIYSKRTAGVDFALPENDLHRPFVDELVKDLPIRTNGRTPDETEGDSVS
jgi:hypothetical protein